MILAKASRKGGTQSTLNMTIESVPQGVVFKVNGAVVWRSWEHDQ